MTSNTIKNESGYIQIIRSNRGNKNAPPLPPTPNEDNGNSFSNNSNPFAASDDVQMNDDAGIYDMRTLQGLNTNVSSDDDDDDDAAYDKRTTQGLPSSIKPSRPLPRPPAESNALPPKPPKKAPRSKSKEKPSFYEDTQITFAPKPPSRPSLRVQKINKSEAGDMDVSSLPQFHGSLDRNGAESLLQTYPPGAYLIRTSRAVNGYVISANTLPGKRVHIKVTRSGVGFSTTDQSFETFKQLLFFYKNNSIHSGVPLGVEVCK